ncbi:MAG: hypothetical protein Kow0088_05630 [Anaerolineales bacterium]
MSKEKELADRLCETICLRIQDDDFADCTLTVRDGSSKKDGIVSLPQTVIPDLHRQIERVYLLPEEDIVAAFGEASLP